VTAAYIRDIVWRMWAVTEVHIRDIFWRRWAVTEAHFRDITSREQVCCDCSVGKIVKAWKARLQSPLKNHKVIRVRNFTKKNI
jgi:hypothetical protein